jgi:TM2 domain-containing membrane protein YozV
MNCANHNNVPAAAYCRTCGKPLCEQCKRDVRGVIYCEECIAKKLEGTLPPASAVPPTPVVVTTTGPNAALAGILAGFFPFGVGQVYNGQYAKGLAHLLVFALLIVGVATLPGDWPGPLFGLAIAFFYVYQIVDAVRSAKAIQLGLPAPDPFGLGTAFSIGSGTPGGSKLDTSRIPVGALVLIGIGVLFLLNNLFDIYFVHRLWPLILIAVGALILMRRRSDVACNCDRCTYRCLMGPAVLITLGVLFELNEFWGWRAGFHRTWPILLLVIGAIKILQATASGQGHVEPPPAVIANAPPAPAPDSPKEEVHRG